MKIKYRINIKGKYRLNMKSSVLYFDVCKLWMIYNNVKNGRED